MSKKHGVNPQVTGNAQAAALPSLNREFQLVPQLQLGTNYFLPRQKPQANLLYKKQILPGSPAATMPVTAPESSRKTHCPTNEQ